MCLLPDWAENHHGLILTEHVVIWVGAELCSLVSEPSQSLAIHLAGGKVNQVLAVVSAELDDRHGISEVGVDGVDGAGVVLCRVADRSQVEANIALLDSLLKAWVIISDVKLVKLVKWSESKVTKQRKPGKMVGAIKQPINR